ncbi:septal ring lytic transglycosylase RlpA family protein [Piscinibacter sp.]|uniref:septal ring lytic transglycosylase RlpA family protein n=1 Tax=Piscinibacter sp. TaxID=1903157 RepID=UPI002B9DE445|nr:septal ring lytic transglycosylase RlpA family protein [Albitalea sp.]HUG22614.1 septal ring lytic transglycosylase RlpA family protein [Albitalea sp.]
MVHGRHPHRKPRRAVAFLVLAASLALVPNVAASAPAAADPAVDVQRGKASFYSHRFAGKTMADGTPFDPESFTAASKTLPLGSKARVVNLRNGKSVVVDIRDRGPFVKGRIIDVSPKAARALGMGRAGVVRVEVTPIADTPDP